MLLVNLPVVALIVGLGAWVLPSARRRTPARPALGAVFHRGHPRHGLRRHRTGPRRAELLAGLPRIGGRAVLLAVFLRRQGRMKVPLLDIDLFREVRFSAAVIAQLMTVFANVGCVVLHPDLPASVQ